jgi:hypothetical protein
MNTVTDLRIHLSNIKRNIKIIFEEEKRKNPLFKFKSARTLRITFCPSVLVARNVFFNKYIQLNNMLIA